MVGKTLVMTESEAYDLLGWPKSGNTLFLVLPISGSERTDWIVYECPCDCGYRGLGLPEYFENMPEEMKTCPRCNVPWLKRGD